MAGKEVEGQAVAGLEEEVREVEARAMARAEARAEVEMVTEVTAVN